jgi:uncharacterized membrane protein
MFFGSWKKTLLIFVAVHVFLFLCVLPLLALAFYPGTGTLELFLAERMLEGKIPYHDFPSEYPPLALLSFLLPGLVAHHTVAYSVAFAAELMICDLLIMLMLADLSSFFKISVRRTLAVYTLLILATGAILVCRYDLLPAMFVMAALWAFIKGKNKLAWAAAGLGFAAKLYPVIILPFFVIYQFRNRQYRRLVEGGVVFLALLIVFSLPWVIIDAPGYWQSWTYHLERGLHAESTYGTALLVGQVLGLTGVTGELTFGSWNLSSPLADSLAKMSFYIFTCLLIIVYGIYAWRSRKDAGESAGTALSAIAAARLIQYSALAVIVFMLANKVFSAQYLVWLCPLLPLINGGKDYIITTLFVAAAFLTQYVYPYNYTPFELGEALPVFVLFLRNVLLVVAAVLIALSWRHQMPGSRALRPGG